MALFDLSKMTADQVLNFGLGLVESTKGQSGEQADAQRALGWWIVSTAANSTRPCAPFGVRCEAGCEEGRVDLGHTCSACGGKGRTWPEDRKEL